MKLIALKEFTPDGTIRYRKNQTFEISAASARLLIALKVAKPAPTTDDDDPKRAHLYKRRDMRAEN